MSQIENVPLASAGRAVVVITAFIYREIAEALATVLAKASLSKSGDRLVFVRLKNREQLYEEILVRLAGRTIAVWFDPFRVLLAERVVNLMLELNVRANFAK